MSDITESITFAQDNIHARCHDGFATLTSSAPPRTAPATPKPTPTGKESPLVRTLERLQKNVSNRPKKKKTLLRQLKSFLGKEATEADAKALFEKLCQAGHLSIGGNEAVTYHVQFRLASPGGRSSC